MVKIVTISHLVKKLVKDKPYLEEALARKIISYGNLAEQVIPQIEKELNKEVRHSAVVMALRRYSDELEKTSHPSKKFDYSSEIVMKTNICDFNVVKSSKLLNKIKTLYTTVNFERGDFLNIVMGNYEISIIINEKHTPKLKKILQGEKILNKEFDLVALTITFKDDFVHSPGVIFNIIRQLVWESINILEIISTNTELTFILTKKDSMKAYNSLQGLVGGKDG